MSDNCKYPFLNPDLPLDERIDDLISRLTLEEKAGLIPIRQQAIERLGIGDWNIGTEAARGYIGYAEKQISTVFPQPIGMASTFDTELMYKAGEIASTEARIHYSKERNGKLMLWAPTVDLCRHPLWGRNEEAYGEDPYLAGEMTKQYTLGMRGDDDFYYRAMPALKHFCANNNEQNRTSSSSNLNQRLKHEYYYAAFKPAIESGGACSIMTSYNEISGLPADFNPDIKNTLKDEWGLKFAVTDQDDFCENISVHRYCDTFTQNIALALKAGCDTINDSTDIVISSVLKAVEEKTLTEEDVNRAIYNTLWGRFKLGEFDPQERNPYSNIDSNLLDCEQYREVNYKLAAESIVLLKDDGLLPLKNAKTVFITGPIADEDCRDWYKGLSSYSHTVYDGIKDYFGEDNVVYDDGYDRVALKSVMNGKYISVDGNGNVFANADTVTDSELFIKQDWGGGNIVYRSAKTNMYLSDKGIIKADSESIFGWFISALFIQDCETGYAVFTNYNGTKHIGVGEDGALTTFDKHGVNASVQFEETVISCGAQRASELAKKADVAIVCVGNNPMIIARETSDRTELKLPEKQSELALSVAEANSNSVLAVIAGYPYSIVNESCAFNSVLYMSHSGPELGNAFRDTIIGKNNPSGRTPQTWYRYTADLPSIFDYDISKSKYTYQYFEGEVLYPFGYGLSYSNFVYLDMKLSESKDSVIAELKITNDSSVAGDEVVQIYYSVKDSKVIRPIKKLCAFKRVHFKPYETKKIMVEISKSSLEFYDVVKEKHSVEDGTYCFMACASSNDVKLSDYIHVSGEKFAPRCLENLIGAQNFDEQNGTLVWWSKLNSCYFVAAKSWGSVLKYNNSICGNATEIEVQAAVGYYGKGRIVFEDGFGNVIAEIGVKPTSAPDIFDTFKASVQFKPDGVFDLQVKMSNGVNLLSFAFK